MMEALFDLDNVEQLYKTKQQSLNIIDFLPDPTFVIDRNQKVVAWNTAIEEMTGVSKVDIIGKGEYAYAIPFYGKARPVLLDLIFSDDLTTELKYKNVVRKGNAINGEAFIKLPFNNKEVFLWLKASPLFDSEGNIVGAIESVRDITKHKQAEEEIKKYRDHLKELVIERTIELKTANEQLQREISERKQVEESLREIEERYRQLVENSPDAILLHSKDRLDFINEAGAKLFGTGSPREAVGITMINLIHPDYQEIVAEKWRQVQDEGKIAPLKEEKIVRLDGKVIDIEVVTAPCTIQGKPKMQAVARNITDRKRAEKALRLSEERFYKAFYNNPIPMAIVRFSDDRHTEVNKSYEHFFGYNREDVIDRTVLDLGLGIEEFKLYNKLLTEQGFIRNLNVLFKTKRGDFRNVLLSCEIIELSNEKCRLATINDITDLKKMENKMARLERLNLVGQMAAGIGHEIRNPMTTIRGFLQLLKGKERYAQDQNYMNTMIEELDRANTIISGFLSLARNKVEDIKIQSLNERIEDLFPLFSADAMEKQNDIKLELSVIPDLLLDKNEIHQLILNLVRNGIEAMEPGGVLTIKTFQDGNEVVLAVQDQGKGIPPENLEKIGQPFFTTKENGTGLGLATCYSIAERHNAKIDIETSTDGTTIFIRFKAS
ncbi:MAG: Sporulation kinase E [Pelotomaculum sp. PtaB.Bin104]|nr:MAG: Sporulation kinase E [Pelotomaculum sp. PtaB.Bin104]